jgi:hypothetical protein
MNLCRIANSVAHTSDMTSAARTRKARKFTTNNIRNITRTMLLEDLPIQKSLLLRESGPSLTTCTEPIIKERFPRDVKRVTCWRACDAS